MAYFKLYSILDLVEYAKFRDFFISLIFTFHLIYFPDPFILLFVLTLCVCVFTYMPTLERSKTPKEVRNFSSREENL